MAIGLGIDLGADSIKIVQAQVSNGVVTVTGALKIPRGAKNIPVLDAPVPAEESNNTPVVPENLGAELKNAGLRRAGTLGISGREVMLKYLSTPPMPPDKLKLYIDMEVGGKMGSKSEGPTVMYDYRLISLPSGGLRNDLALMAGVCKNEYLYSVHDALKAAGAAARRISPSCFGLVNAYLHTTRPPAGETVVLVDIGHELMEIAILEENHVYFARSAPGGGKKFTAALDKVLKNGMAKAEEFKHARAKLYPEGTPIPSKQELAFQAALKEGADNIASAIRSSATFCRTQLKLPKLEYQRVFISGGGARLSGLREYLEKKIGKPVQVLELYKELDLRKLDAASARCFEGEVPDMAVALGLAVIDADPKCFHFSLIPEKIVKRRIFLQKTVYAIAAAVILMLSLISPMRNSSEAVELQNARIAELKELKEKTKTLRDSFEKRKVENTALAKQADYYARQTRLPHVYLNLFTTLRKETPDQVMIIYVGPREGGGGGGGINAVGEDFMRDVYIRGHYDTDTYPGTKFDDAFDKLRQKLLEIPGITDVGREDITEVTRATGRGEAAKIGQKDFAFIVTIQDSSRPLAPAKQSTAAATPGGNNVAQKGP
jgi:type IV pilus assembly protein PilM